MTVRFRFRWGWSRRAAGSGTVLPCRAGASPGDRRRGRRRGACARWTAGCAVGTVLHTSDESATPFTRVVTRLIRTDVELILMCRTSQH